ncbi:MAG: hypothetical protein D6712_00900 [Chloroflexi bacterium]|nr:MAG: hypothetical protein D6712_00900 [Chloroflexota bacterium]
MELKIAPLRAVIEQANVQSLFKLATQPAVKGVYRLTAFYPDRRAHHSIATLTYTAYEEATLEVIYIGAFHNRPLTHTITWERLEQFESALRKAGFDKLHDQNNVSVYGEDCWLLERAAGSFSKSILLAPHRVEQPYTTIVNAIDAYLPEMIREVTR